MPNLSISAGRAERYRTPAGQEFHGARLMTCAVRDRMLLINTLAQRKHRKRHGRGEKEVGHSLTRG